MEKDFSTTTIPHHKAKVTTKKVGGVWADYQNLFHNEGIYNTKTNVFSVGVTYDF